MAITYADNGQTDQLFTKSFYAQDYSSLGYNVYLTKSIDLPSMVDPTGLSTPNQYQDNNINYTNSEVSGAIGDIVTVGNITLDGTIGRIKIADPNGVDVTWIGYISDDR